MARATEVEDFTVADADYEVSKYIPIWRKQQVGGVSVGSGPGNITAMALFQIAEFVQDAQDRKSVSKAPIHDSFEFQYEGHRVQVRLGDACEEM